MFLLDCKGKGMLAPRISLPGVYPELMNSGTVTGAALSLGAAGIWGGGDFAGGIAAKRANVFRVVAGAHACGLVLMLALAWVTREPMPPRSSLYWGVVAGITGGLGIAALYKALAIGRMGIVAPIASVITGVLPVLVGFRTEGLPDRCSSRALVSLWSASGLSPGLTERSTPTAA